MVVSDAILDWSCSGVTVQLFDRAGVLYGEVARFVLRLLGFRSRSTQAAKKAALQRKGEGAAPKSELGPHVPQQAPGFPTRRLPPPRPGMPGGGGWDNLWPSN